MKVQWQVTDKIIMGYSSDLGPIDPQVYHAIGFIVFSCECRLDVAYQLLTLC
jgi:hypothetical protein